ncbi:antibiotic biosynthesis monooxygenase [Anaerotignum sp.]
MIVLIAKNTLKEGNQEEFIRIAGILAEETRKEPGCLSYDLAKDETEDTVFYFIEKYKDEAALEAHRASAYFQTYVPMLGALRTKPSEVSKCVIIDF